MMPFSFSLLLIVVSVATVDAALLEVPWRILLDSFDEARNFLNSLRRDRPALDVPVSSMMPCVTFTTSLPLSPLLPLLSEATSSLLFRLLRRTRMSFSIPTFTPLPPESPELAFLVAVSHLPKNSRAAYWLATVAHAAPAAPPNIPPRGTNTTSPRKLTMAAAANTYNGDFTSCMPRQALWAVPMTTMAGIPNDLMRTYCNAAENTMGSRASFPMSVLNSNFPDAPNAMPNTEPTSKANLSAVINVSVVFGCFVICLPSSLLSSLSSCTAAAIKLVVAVYMNATTSAP
mmetsp:Transcript_29257/g.62111  ORF Transcript_29257/g.62111 Transcript_29257/m.62111 type:complete len:288 (-) Transcript_29257:140-1003(-)